MNYNAALGRWFERTVIGQGMELSARLQGILQNAVIEPENRESLNLIESQEQAVRGDRHKEALGRDSDP